jgi:hypothetical protein
MTDRDRARIVIDDEDGRPVAAADIAAEAPAADAGAGPAATRVSLHVESGHVPPGTRARLVDAVLDAPEVSAGGHLSVALPIGDTEILDSLRERCDTDDVRAAGATCLMEAELREPQGRAAAPDA